MASLDFPSNPVDQQQYSLNGIVYYYNAAIGAWLTVLSSKVTDTSSNTQILFNDAGFSNGTYGLVFNKSANTLTTNTIVATGNVTISGTTSATNVTVSGTMTATTITETSSIAFKENVESLSFDTDVLDKLDAVMYDRIGHKKTSKEVGLIAEDVYHLIPELVQLDEKGKPLGIHYSRLSIFLLHEIKNLRNEIKKLKDK